MQFNFIVGDNGSGKSAILSGIVAGLGGRAFDTGRANSMKGMHSFQHGYHNSVPKAYLIVFQPFFVSLLQQLLRTGSRTLKLRSS